MFHLCTDEFLHKEALQNHKAAEGKSSWNIKQVKLETVSSCELICDPLSENPALRANIEFELEEILSIQVVFQLNSDYCTKVLQGACTVSY